MDPRIRQRRIAVQREQGRRRLRVLLLLLGTVGMVAGLWGVSRAPIFDVEQVHIDGASRTSREDILSTAGLDRRRPLADIDVEAAAERIERLPWVYAAYVERRWPDEVHVSVTERVPIAVVAVPDAAPVLVDDTGRVLGPAGDGDELPVVEGIPAPGPPGSVVSVPTTLEVLTILDREPAARAIHVQPGGEIEILLVAGPRVRLGDGTDLVAKIQALRTLARRADLSGVAVVDVRVPSAPTLTRT